MLKNAHMRSMGAALIRAVGLVERSTHAEMATIRFPVTLEDKFRFEVGLFADERWVQIVTHCYQMEGNGRNQSRISNQSSPFWLGLRIEQLSKRLRR
jgi:hypothetical protein